MRKIDKRTPPNIHYEEGMPIGGVVRRRKSRYNRQKDKQALIKYVNNKGLEKLTEEEELNI